MMMMINDDDDDLSRMLYAHVCSPVYMISFEGIISSGYAWPWMNYFF